MDDSGFDPSKNQGNIPYIRSRVVFVEGIRITPEDCPPCIFDEDHECETCEFFIPSKCRLRNNPIYRHDIRVNLELIIEQQIRVERERKKYLERRNQIINAAAKELREHGRPLHYIYLAKIIRSRYPSLKVTDSEVLRAICDRMDIFNKIEEGIYGSAK